METKPEGEMPPINQSEPQVVPETETKEPTLEEQAQVYADMYKKVGKNVEVSTILEAARDLRHDLELEAGGFGFLSRREEEIKEFQFLIYVPGGFTTEDAWSMVHKRYNYPRPILRQREKIDTSGSVAFTRFSQEPDVDSVGGGARSPKDWVWEQQTSGEKFISFKELIVAREAFYRLTGKQMDVEHSTMCPNSRIVIEGTRSDWGMGIHARSHKIEIKGVPKVNYDQFERYGKYSYVSPVDPDDAGPGIRRIKQSRYRKAGS